MVPFWPSAELSSQPNAPGIRSSLPCWCARGSWQLCFRTARFGLVQCCSCGCYRIDPPPLSTDDELQRFYTDYYAARENVEQIRPSNRFWRVASQIPDLAFPGECVADIGCGDGHLCAQLKSRGWERVVGVDVSRTRIAAARRLYPNVTFYHQPLRETDVKDGTFDLMIMDNVIEHLASPQRAIEELCRYLKPGGRLLVITPNMESGSFRLLGRYWTPELAPDAHVFLFTRRALVNLLERAGVQAVSIGGFQPRLPAREWFGTLGQGDLKSFIWRTGQRLGTLYGRMIGSGDMTYVLCARALEQRAAVENPVPVRNLSTCQVLSR